MLLIGIALNFLNPQPADNLFGDFITPVLAFEFMQNAEETARLFEVDDVLAYRNSFFLGNNLDYIFMFLYSAFLAITGLGILRERRERLMWIPIVLSVLIFMGDLLENATMAGIVETFINGDQIAASSYGNLFFFTWLKWGGIAAALLMYSVYFFQGAIWKKLLAGLCLAQFGLSVGAFFHRSILNELMALATIAVFIGLVVHHAAFRVSPIPDEAT